MKRLALLLLVLLRATAAWAQPNESQDDDKAGAIPAKYVISPNREAVAKAIDACTDSMACPLLSNFKASQKEAYYWVRAWCTSQRAIGTKLKPEASRVCGATLLDTPAELDKVPSLDLVALRATIAPAKCGGFGLTVPLYSVRYVDDGTVARGPIEAGLGGGYYFGDGPLSVCRSSFSAGPELFAWSEGLDPSGLFHVGVAGGYGISAFNYFSAGISIGYDLYRTEANVPENGLLTGKRLGKESLTWLLTLSFSSVEQQKSSGQ